MDGPARYRKKPVIIEALQYDGNNCRAVVAFMGEEHGIGEDACCLDGCVYIETKEGVMKASSGDFIIKGVQGEFYPCKPDIFEATYELVPPAAAFVHDYMEQRKA